jgi:hypothetical protein
MKKYLPLLIGSFYSFSAFSFEITSKIQEGALIYGQLNKDEKLLIGSTEMYSYGWTDEIYGICKGTNIIEKPLTYEEIEEL